MRRLLAKLLSRLETSRRRGSRERQRPGPRRPWLEALGNRTLLSILFGDSPVRTTSDNNGPLLASAQVRLVFWGSGWSAYPTLQAQMQSAVDALNSSTYFYSTLPGANLSQYRVGTAARPTRVASFNDSYDDPGATFTDGQVFNMLSHEFGSATGYYYYVIPPPGSAPSGVTSHSYHSFGTVSGNRLYYGWSRDLATPSLDDLTESYSHEMVESITDPDGTALQVNPRNAANWNEISDGEAENYDYRVNGVLAQSYWSQTDGNFTVPTGQTQNFYVDSNRNLMVNGDQLSNHNDTITVDASSGGGVTVTLNGETAQFDPGTLDSVEVNAADGADTLTCSGRRSR